MANRETSKEKLKNKRKLTGFIFWLVFAVTIIICFLVAKGRIASVLRETDFFNEVVGSEPQLITDLVNAETNDNSHEKSRERKAFKLNKKGKKADKENSENQLIEETGPGTQEVQQEIPQTEAGLTERPEIDEKAEKEMEKAEKEGNAETSVIAERKEEDTQKAETKQNVVVAEQPKMHLNLCFVSIDSDGMINRRECIRNVEKNDSPLTTAINQLLAGPTPEEGRKGYISVIPQETKLLGAKIQNRTAILNFNDAFTINHYGVQGQISQLMQIVYTATSFSTIDNVQFLIEGEKIQYLGGEGVWIGSPLARDSFN